MAIAFDVAAQGASNWSHTCTGSNLLLVVTVFSAGDTVTAVTYNGVAMTLIAKVGEGGSTLFSYTYYLIAPAVGSHTVAVTGAFAQGASASYTGCLPSGQPDASASLANQTGSPVTGTVTTVADNCWAVLTGVQSGSTVTYTSCTNRITDTSGILLADTNGVKHPAGSVAMSVSQAAGTSWATIAFSLAPAPPAINTGNMFQMF
jgi:hypothetical protein